jgi:hypothetical protein
MATIEPPTLALGSSMATIVPTAESDAERILALRVATARETDFLSCHADEIQSTVVTRNTVSGCCRPTRFRNREPPRPGAQSSGCRAPLAAV